MINGHSINHKSDSNVIIPDRDAKNSFSDLIRTYEKEKQAYDLTCKIYKEDVFKYEIRFQKRSDVLVTGYQYFHTTTNKSETIEFYNYFDHLKNLGFKWENDVVLYKITLSANQEFIEKKFWSKVSKYGVAVNEATILTEDERKLRSLNNEYLKTIPTFFKDKLKDGKQ